MAVNKGRMFNLDMDATNAMTAMGIMTGMTAEIRTAEYTSSVINMAHARLSQLFDWHLDEIAKSTTVTATTGRTYSPLHHVYEWGQTGDPAGRLWKHVLQGNGANRTASFEFKASNKAVPHPYHDGGRAHVFHWKAVIMEYSIPVYVKPKEADKLAWFMNGQWNFSGGVRIDNPGGETTGQFTNAWTSWWNSVAPQEFEQVVAKTVEEDLSNSGNETIRRVRKKKVGLSTITDADKAFELGRQMGQERIRRDAKSYSTVSREILRGLSD